MAKANVNGIDIFYEIEGTGEPLLLIAGFSCDHSYWSLQMPALVKEYQVICFDNRGCGRTSAPDSPYSIEQMANDTAALLEHIGKEKVHVAGHSMGGLIAQELALAHPEKIESLMLISSLAGGDGLFNSIVSSWGELAGKIEPKLYQQMLLPWVFTDAFYSMPGMIEMILNMTLKYPFAPPSHTLYHQSRSLIACDTSQRLKDIHCPSLVLVSKQDILTPVKFSQQLAEGIPNSELVVVDSGGHALLIESAENVASEMLKFLAKFAKKGGY